MPATVNITCENDADFYRSFVYQDTAGNPIDLTGCSMVMKLRRHAEDVTAFLTLSTETGEITIDNPTGGQFVIWITQTNLLELSLGPYDQSLILTINGIKKAIWSGSLVVEPGASR
jgi:hypothetical protein